MKRLFILLALSALSTSSLMWAATPADIAAQWTAANDQYARAQYDSAAVAYQLLLDSAVLTTRSQAQVYYNLGNARFKQGELAASILAYERALRLRPLFKDARYNLAFARTQIVDNIEDNRAFFVATWCRFIRDLLTTNTWLWISILSCVLCLTGLLLFLLLRIPAARKTAFIVALLAFFCSLIGGANAASLQARDKQQREAIITQGIVVAKSSPDRSGTELFTLHEGTKVSIRETIGDWCNVQVGNHEGWLPINTLTRI